MNTLQEHVPQAISWIELAAHEPRLDHMLAYARSARKKQDCCFKCLWLRSILNFLTDLVGPRSPHQQSFLGTSEALHVAEATLVEALPKDRLRNCPNCKTRIPHASKQHSAKTQQK
jgi:hypothetical protein